MRRLFADCPEALRNTATLTERCAGAVRLSSGLRFPAASLPEGQDPIEKLRALAFHGAREKYRASKEVAREPELSDATELPALGVLSARRALLPVGLRGEGDRQREGRARDGEGQRRQLPDLLLPRAHPAGAFR